MGVVVAEPVGDDHVQPVQGHCELCGYEISWMLILS
jgi:hypothetical protein